MYCYGHLILLDPIATPSINKREKQNVCVSLLLRPTLQQALVDSNDTSYKENIEQDVSGNALEINAFNCDFDTREQTRTDS